MAKITAKVTLVTPTETKKNIYNAIFHQNTQEIIYQEEDKTITKINLKEPRLRRENVNLWMEYVFNQQVSTNGIIKVKDVNQEVLVNIKTSKIKQQNNNIEIEYQLENENYKYKLEVIK